jgi:hypothetical protein
MWVRFPPGTLIDQFVQSSLADLIWGKFVREPGQTGPKISCLLHWQMELNSIRLSELKVGVIINRSSGGCDSESEQKKMLSILNRAGIVESKAWCGAAEEMERSFADAPNTAVTINA